MSEKKQKVKVSKQLPIHKFIATGGKPENYKGAKKGFK